MSPLRLPRRTGRSHQRNPILLPESAAAEDSYRPEAAAVSNRPVTRALTSALASCLPRPSLKIQLSVSEDHNDGVRQCGCGTPLPPPDVHRHNMCDTCWPRRTAKQPIGSRVQLESTWSTIAQNCSDKRENNAAPGITFVNDVDDEELPPSLHDGLFEYLENRYRVDEELGLVLFPGDATPLADPSAFFICHNNNCDVPETYCHDAGPGLNNGLAYTNGLFNFSYAPHSVVVECNPYCGCPTTCPNRVAQRPRRVPIEVFKTAGGRRGWGVRAPVEVCRGEVIGLHTGKLISRADAESLSGAQNRYCFDLDYDEDDIGDPAHRYSVNSYACGNWTRFINHSCTPNTRPQPVVYDTLPSQGIAFLAFIATEHIAPRTEFTFDYDPAAQQRPHGARTCLCGTDRCRGWVQT